MRVDADRLDWLRGWIEQNPGWSRKRLACELCVCWDWRNERGRLKDFAARSFLLKLEARGWIGLPVLQEKKRRLRKSVAELCAWEEPSRWEGSVQDVGPVALEVVNPGTPEAGRWAYLLDRHHYLEPVPKAEMPMKRPLFAGRWGIKAADFLPGRQNSCL